MGRSVADELAQELKESAELSLQALARKDAIRDLREALNMEPDLSDEMSGEIRLLLAYALNRNGDYVDVQSALGRTLQSKDPRVKGTAQVRLSDALHNLGDAERAAEFARSASVILAREDLAGTSEAFIALGHAEDALGRTAAAERAYGDAFTFGRLADSPRHVVCALGELAFLRQKLGTFHEAKKSTLEAVDLCDRHGLTALGATGALSLGISQYYLAEWDDAWVTAQNALRRQASIANHRGVAMVHLLLLRIAYRSGRDWKTALKRAERAVEKTTFRQAPLSLLEYRGEIALAEGQYEDAAQDFEELIRRVRPETPNSSFIYERAWQLGAIALELHGGVAEAEDGARRSLEGALAADNHPMAALARTALARVLHRTGRTAEADREIRTAMEVFRRCGMRYELLQACELAAAILPEAERAACRSTAESVRATLGRPTPESAEAIPVVPLPSEAPTFIARDPYSRRIVELGRELGSFEGPVLIQGESGVGKMLFARLVHSGAARRDRPVRILDCAGWSANGPDADVAALLRAEAGGTVVLRHVDQAPRELQSRLVAALDAVGDRPDAEPVRVLTTISGDPGRQVESGALLKPLLYRVTGFTVEIPELHERPDDIDALTDWFVDGPEVTASARAALRDHDWPGNVRELREALRAARFSAGDGPIDRKHLPVRIGGKDRSEAPAERVLQTTLTGEIEELERRRIRHALLATENNKRRAAERLGVSRKGLIDRLKRLGMWQEFGRG